MSVAPQPSSDLPEVTPGIRRSQEAYWRDLPQLLPLRSRKREWVAYHGDERVGFGPDRAELYHECYRRGYKADEVYIGRLVLQHAPPWEPIDLDDYGEIVEASEPEALPGQTS